jgi:hypothetical protein
LTALRTGGPLPAAAAATEQVPEQAAEVTDVAVERERLAVARTEATEAARPHTRRHHASDFVVLLALLRIAQDVVRRGDVLEVFLGFLVSGIRVRVVLLRQLLIGARDVLVGRTLRYAEHVVIVLLEPLALRCQLASSS